MMNCEEIKTSNLMEVDDLKLLFKFNNITTNFNDEELEQLINITQKNMLAELGITLKPIHHTYTVYPNYTEPRKQTKVPITLPLVHLKNVDKITINNKKLVEEVDYDVDYKNSVIYLKPRHRRGLWYWFWHWYWNVALSVKIDYTTQFDDEIILDLLNSLLGDLLIYGQTPANQRDIKSIKEGDVTVSWDNENAHTLPKAIQNKKDNILDLLNTTRVHMI